MDFPEEMITVLHNGDFSGEIVLLSHEEGRADVTLPFRLIEKIVAEKIRRDKIRKLEDASAEDILSGR